eukprot:1859856-Prymnesium_polylepis.1
MWVEGYGMPKVLVVARAHSISPSMIMRRVLKQRVLAFWSRIVRKFHLDAPRLTPRTAAAVYLFRSSRGWSTPSGMAKDFQVTTVGGCGIVRHPLDEQAHDQPACREESATGWQAKEQLRRVNSKVGRCRDSQSIQKRSLHCATQWERHVFITPQATQSAPRFETRACKHHVGRSSSLLRPWRHLANSQIGDADRQGQRVGAKLRSAHEGGFARWLASSFMVGLFMYGGDQFARCHGIPSPKLAAVTSQASECQRKNQQCNLGGGSFLS